MMFLYPSLTYDTFLREDLSDMSTVYPNVYGENGIMNSRNDR